MARCSHSSASGRSQPYLFSIVANTFPNPFSQVSLQTTCSDRSYLHGLLLYRETNHVCFWSGFRASFHWLPLFSMVLSWVSLLLFSSLSSWTSPFWGFEMLLLSCCLAHLSCSQAKLIHWNHFQSRRTDLVWGHFILPYLLKFASLSQLILYVTQILFIFIYRI